MRVSPVGFAGKDLASVLREAEKSAAVTHNHPEGIKGACAVAAAVFLAHTGSCKAEIKQYIQATFSYDLELSLDEIRPSYGFDQTCQGTVPPSVTAFLESTDYEDAIRKAISLGGDCDTLACISGGIAQAFYGTIPEEIQRQTKQRLDPDLLRVVEEFETRFKVS